MKRLQKLIQDAVDEGKSLRRISIESGVEYTSISNYFHQEVEPRGKNLGKLADYFGVHFSDLLDEYVPQQSDKLYLVKKTVPSQLEPCPPPSGLIPVVSMASANGDGPCWEECYPVGTGMEMIWRPHDVIDPRAFGIKVDGDSMIPAFRDGDTVVVCPQKQVMSGDEVVAKLKDGRVVVKVIRFVNGHVLLESYNTAHEPIFTEKDQLDFAYKIVWHKRG